VPNDIRQLHSSAYRNAGELPPGPYWVVGSGASGFQIAEDFINVVDKSTSAWVAIGALRDATAVATTLVGVRAGTVRASARGVAGDLSPGPVVDRRNGGYEADWRELASKGMFCWAVKSRQGS